METEDESAHPSCRKPCTESAAVPPIQTPGPPPSSGPSALYSTKAWHSPARSNKLERPAAEQLASPWHASARHPQWETIKCWHFERPAGSASFGWPISVEKQSLTVAHWCVTSQHVCFGVRACGGACEWRWSQSFQPRLHSETRSRRKQLAIVRNWTDSELENCLHPLSSTHNHSFPPTIWITKQVPHNTMNWALVVLHATQLALGPPHPLCKHGPSYGKYQ